MWTKQKVESFSLLNYFISIDRDDKEKKKGKKDFWGNENLLIQYNM